MQVFKLWNIGLSYVIYLEYLIGKLTLKNKYVFFSTNVFLVLTINLIFFSIWEI